MNPLFSGFCFWEKSFKLILHFIFNKRQIPNRFAASIISGYSNCIIKGNNLSIISSANWSLNRNRIFAIYTKIWFLDSAHSNPSYMISSISRNNSLHIKSWWEEIPEILTAEKILIIPFWVRISMFIGLKIMEELYQSHNVRFANLRIWCFYWIPSCSFLCNVWGRFWTERGFFYIWEIVCDLWYIWLLMIFYSEYLHIWWSSNWSE